MTYSNETVVGPSWDMMPAEGIMMSEEPVQAVATETRAERSFVDYSLFAGRASLYENREWTLQNAEMAAYRGGIGF
ncbi:MAG TPA: hypothetical protein VN031_00465 [Candidatus Microsaccharimonas sp.]|nr:hypothetical protein [Candidatus Microsaccharimonas sp.]